MSQPWFHSPWLYAPLALLPAIALFIILLILRRDRTTAARACSRCRYDLSASGDPPITCPECGRIATTELELHRTPPSRLLIAATLALLIAPLIWFTFARGDARRIYYALPPKWTTLEQIREGNTTATLYGLRNPNERGCRAVITNNGKTVLDVDDYLIMFGQAANATYPGQRAAQRLGAGDDLNNDGIKDLVILSYSGGAHCCYTVYIVELSDPPVIAATIDGRNGIGMTRTSEGHVEFNIPDQSFDYWNASHAESPFPSVWYRLKDHRLEIALDRMLHPAEKDLLSNAPSMSPFQRQLASQRDVSLNPDLWRVMLPLIYSGNESDAWAFFDAVWPSSLAVPPGTPNNVPYANAAEFKSAFLSILNASPQYQDLKAAQAALAAGQPIPPARVGQYQPPPDPPR